MTASSKLNCWQFKRCACEPGGAQARHRGVCPVATDTACDGINGGTNAGRFCWAVPRTLCDGMVQRDPEEKMVTCQHCSFFRRVKYEEGIRLQLLKPGLGVADVGELHRLLNNILKLMGIARDILAYLAQGPLLARIVEHAAAITGSCSASAYMVEPDGKQVILEAHAGPTSRPDRVRLEEDCPVAAAARRRRFCKEALVVPGCGERATVAAVPVGGHEELLGVLELVKADGRFSPDDEWFLREFGLIAELGVENARHAENLRQLKRFDKAKSRFVALLMHHITSPLATVACSLQAIAQIGDELAEEDRRQLLANSMDRIGSIQKLSKRLLDLAAIRSGRSLGDIQPVRPAEVLAQQTEARQARAREKGLKIVVTDNSGDAEVMADPDGLQIIFGNLIGNAIKYSRDSSEVVRVNLSAMRDSVRIDIRDTGIGISPEEQTRVFEEFQRGSNASAAHASGFGIGLTIVKELVDRYQGRVELESKPGVGTTVSVELPRSATP